MSEVIRSNAVDQDLLDIWLYIAGDNPNAADRQLERIDHKCRLCATQPEIGQPRPDLGTDVRCFGVDKYVVVYRPRGRWHSAPACCPRFPRYSPLATAAFQILRAA